MTRLRLVLDGGLKWLLLVVSLIAVSDVSFQWFDFRMQMRMSSQDVKNENK